QAVSFALDRKRLQTLAGGAGGQITCQVLPPGFEGYKRYCPFTVEPNAGGAWNAPDLARARKLVAASGTKGQAGTGWIPSYLPFGIHAGRSVASVLRSLGYRADAKVTDDIYALSAKRDVQVGVGGWSADYAAPESFFVASLGCSAYTPGSTGNTNIGGFCDP